MAKLITKSESFIQDNSAKCLIEVRCDGLDDITPANTEWALGSIAMVISEKAFYVLSSDGTWTKWCCETV